MMFTYMQACGRFMFLCWVVVAEAEVWGMLRTVRSGIGDWEV